MGILKVFVSFVFKMIVRYITIFETNNTGNYEEVSFKKVKF